LFALYAKEFLIMEERVLTACRRTGFGKAAAAKCRRANRLPAVIYDNAGRSTAIEVPYRDFEKLFKTVTESTLITVKVDEKDEFEVFIKDYQYDIVNDKVYHADFYAVERGQLRPVIEKKYSLEELGAAQDRVAEKHTRGKLVVVM